MDENWAVDTPSEMSLLTSGELDTVYLFKMRKLMRWYLDKSHTSNRQQRKELGLESFAVKAPAGESLDMSLLESWKTWTLKLL